MASVEELLEQFKQLPDWDRYPLPEAYYTTFNLKKPKAATLSELICYNPPPYESLNEGGKTELRGPVPGGVRQLPEAAPLPVEVKRLNEETQQLEDYPAPDPQAVERVKMMETYMNNPGSGSFFTEYTKFWNDIKNISWTSTITSQNDSYTLKYSDLNLLNPPIADSKKETPHE